MICREYRGILILSVLPAASYIYTKPPYRKNLLSSPHFITVSFLHTTPTFRYISSPDPLTRFQLLIEFLLPEHSRYPWLFRYHSATPVHSIFQLTLVPNLQHFLVCFLCVPKTFRLQLTIRPDNYSLSSQHPQLFPKWFSPNANMQCCRTCQRYGTFVTIFNKNSYP